MEKKGIIDRIEEDILVIEIEENMYDVSIEKAYDEVKEGDVVDVVFEENEIVGVRKNEDATKSRKEYIEDLVKDMWE